MFSLALTLALALAAPPSAAGTVLVEAPPITSSQPGTVQVVTDPTQARALCTALLPSERLATKGDVVARAQAEDEQDARREAALAGRYRVMVPAERLKFGSYDRDEQELTLSDRTFLAAANGTLHLWMVSQAGLPVAVDPATAQRLAQAAAQRKLTLALTFTLPDVTMIDAHSVIVTGKGYGATQVMVLNHAGRMLLDSRVTVSAPDDGHLTLYRGGAPSEFSCSPRCQALGPKAAAPAAAAP
jgi:hypothetical protein